MTFPPMATIITDASFIYSGEASWAGTIITHLARAEYSGKCKQPLTSSFEAELVAVVNTLHLGLRAGIVPSTFGWLVQSDNQAVVQLLNFHFENPAHRRKPKRAPASTALILTAVQKLHHFKQLAQPGFIYARHVKGHMRLEDRQGRHHVQERMDKLATKARREQ